VLPPGPVAPPDTSLTGAWLADDGGIYFLRQLGGTLWWVGLSQAGAFYPGLHFCNVFHGTVTGTIVTGEWSDVPRGSTANRGQLALRLVDGSPAEQRLLRDSATGGFSGSSWRRAAGSPWPAATTAGILFHQVLKNVHKLQILFWGGDNETLADNLFFIKDAASVFGTVKAWKEHNEKAVLANYPPDQSRSYSDFICFNNSLTYGVGGVGDQPDGDVTFYFLIDRDQVRDRQPAFFAGIEQEQTLVFGTMLAPVEGEIIMYGRAANCDAKEATPPLFPGWAEPAGSSVLFNGRPIPAIFPSPGMGPGQHTFLSDLAFEDPVRVTGALVFDDGHAPNIGHGPMEIHPVYSVDKITATFSSNLSGAWADDVGNTYYLRHDPADNAVWFAGLSPHGSVAFGQVFRGTFYPRQVVVGEAAVPEGIGPSPILPQDAVAGEFAAIGLGYGTAPPFETSGMRLGDTGAVTFGLGQTRLAGRDVPMLVTGDVRRGDYFRLMKLYDA
jgi:hypothetical protein